MFWLLKKIFGLGVAIAVVFFALHLQVGGRPVKDYLADFYKSPIVQKVLDDTVRQGKDAVLSYLKKDVAPSASDADAPPMEHVEEEERKELEEVLKKESH